MDVGPSGGGADPYTGQTFGPRASTDYSGGTPRGDRGANEVLQLRQEVLRIRQENVDLMRELDETRASIASAKARAQERDAALSREASTNASLRDQIASLQQALSSGERASRTAIDQAQKIAQLEATVQQQERDLDEATEALETAVNNLSTERKTVQQLQAQLASVTEAKTALEEENDTLRARIHRQQATSPVYEREQLPVRIEEEKTEPIRESEAQEPPAVRDEELLQELDQLRHAVAQLEEENATLAAGPILSGQRALLERLQRAEAEADSSRLRVAQLEQEVATLRRLQPADASPSEDSADAPLDVSHVDSSTLGAVQRLKKDLQLAQREAADAEQRAQDAEIAAQRSADEAAQLKGRLQALCDANPELEPGEGRAAELSQRLATRDADVCRLVAELNAARRQLERLRAGEALTPPPDLGPELERTRADLDLARRELAICRAELQRAPPEPAPVPAPAPPPERRHDMRCKGIQVLPAEPDPPAPQPVTPAPPPPPVVVRSAEDERELELLRTANSTLRADVAALESQANSAVGEASAVIERLSKRLQLSKRALAQVREERDTLRSQTRATAQQLSQMHSRYLETAGVAAEGDAVRLRLDAVSETIARLENLLADRDAHVARLRSELAQAQAQVALRDPATTRDELYRLRARNSELEGLLEQEMARTLSAQQRTTDLTATQAARLADQGGELEQLRSERARLRTTLRQYRDALALIYRLLGVDPAGLEAGSPTQLERQLRRIEERLSSLADRITQAEELADQARVRAEDAERGREASDRRYKEACGERDDAITRARNAEEQVAALQREVDALRADAEDLRAALDDAEARALAAEEDAAGERAGRRSEAERAADADATRRANLQLTRELHLLRTAGREQSASAAERIRDAENRRRAAELALADARQRLAMRDNVRIQGLEQQVRRLTRENRELLARLDEGEAVFTVHEATREGTNTRGVQTEAGAERASSAAISSQLASARAQVKTLQDRVAELTEKLAQAGRDLAEARNATDQARENAQALARERNRLAARLESSEQVVRDAEATAREVERLRAQIGAAASEKLQLQDEITRLVAEQQRLSDSRRLARDLAASATDARLTDKENVAALKQRISALEAEAARKDQMLVRLRNEVHQLTIGGVSEPLQATGVGHLRGWTERF